ncbi:MAG: tetratricopeptide repeat protein [Myxococcales bacterium]|nr:tetratricopeptide repeat protein [Myxococcales bacterium]
MLTLAISAIVLATNVTDGGLQRELGKTLLKQGRVEEAITRFQAAVKLNPDDAAAWYQLGFANRKAQHFEPAAEAYGKYTAMQPDDPDGWFGYAESLRQSGKTADAVKAYETYFVKETRTDEQKNEAKARIAELRNPAPAAPPKPPDDRVKKGDAAFAAKDFRTALFAYQDAIVADPNNVEALVKAGDTYAKMGHDPEAIAQWNKALQLDPQNQVARAGIAAATERNKTLTQKPAAPAPAPPPPRIDEAAARAHYTTGVGLVRDRKYDDAIAELDQALKAKPSFAVALIARGSARIGQGRFQDAVADYTAAQRADPSLASPLFGLAEAFRGMGQNEKAADLYRQFAASKAPDADPGLKDYALQNAQALSTNK